MDGGGGELLLRSGSLLLGVLVLTLEPAVDGGNEQQGERGGGDEATDDHDGEWALNLRARAVGEEKRNCCSQRESCSKHRESLPQQGNPQQERISAPCDGSTPEVGVVSSLI